MRGTPACEIILEDCRVPKENLIDQEGDGFEIAVRTSGISRPLDAALAVGIGTGALDCATKYAKELEKFGQSISQFQAV
jgi:butyryl-CoA dehydrogenase